MAVRKTTRVSVTISGYSDIHVRDQAAAHFGFENPQPPKPSETVRLHKLTFVKMLRDFEKKFYSTAKDGNGLKINEVGLIGCKKFIEEYFGIY